MKKSYQDKPSPEYYATKNGLYRLLSEYIVQFSVSLSGGVVSPVIDSEDRVDVSDEELRVMFLLSSMLENRRSYRLSAEDVDFVTKYFRDSANCLVIGRENFSWQTNIQEIVGNYKNNGVVSAEDVSAMKSIRSKRDTVSFFDIIEKNKVKLVKSS